MSFLDSPMRFASNANLAKKIKFSSLTLKKIGSSNKVLR
jgi:hypothetical protein